jgi:hypothetical protein
MVMAGIRLVNASRRNPHARKTELHLKRISDGVAILWGDDIDKSTGRGSGLSHRNASPADYQDDEKLNPAEN